MSAPPRLTPRHRLAPLSRALHAAGVRVYCATPLEMPRWARNPRPTVALTVSSHDSATVLRLARELGVDVTLTMIATPSASLP